jgi:hypothetical protein
MQYILLEANNCAANATGYRFWAVFFFFFFVVSNFWFSVITNISYTHSQAGRKVSLSVY